MDCEAIHSRNLFLKNPMSEEEKQFPIAYARIVYKDYRFLEAELATNYHPQNYYCFAVDLKANENFYKKIKSLSNCFNNIIIPKERFSVNSYGKGMGKAFMSCFKELINKKIKWEYILTLQNYDIQIKTNKELIKIFKLLNGACDAEYDFSGELDAKRINGLKKKFNWTFNFLKIFKDETFNEQFSLKLAKGYVQTSLAYPFVKYIVEELNLEIMLKQLDNWNFGADEIFFQTLLTSDDLRAPNAFTHKFWSYLEPICYSGHIRHSICIFGLEDLPYYLNSSKYLFVNKMMPEFDFGAILCWHEEMRKRTIIYKGLNNRLNLNLYKNWPQTRYHKEFLRTRGNLNLNNFKCSEGENIFFNNFINMIVQKLFSIKLF